MKNDLAERVGQNPILGPQDLRPTAEGMEATCLLNQVVFRYNNKRSLGCCLFLAIAFWGSGIAALKYAPPVIALLQLLSIWVAGRILRGLPAMSGGSPLIESCIASTLEA